MEDYKLIATVIHYAKLVNNNKRDTSEDQLYCTCVC